MRRASTPTLLVLAAACWVAAGPGGLTVGELLNCRHEAMPTSHHASTPSDGPCFCEQMAGGFDLAVAPAVPAPLAGELAVRSPVAQPSHPSPFLLPLSPSFAPASPPPNGRA